jgi:hypothetical protein
VIEIIGGSSTFSPNGTKLDVTPTPETELGSIGATDPTVVEDEVFFSENGTLILNDYKKSELNNRLSSI